MKKSLFAISICCFQIKIINFFVCLYFLVCVSTQLNGQQPYPIEPILDLDILTVEEDLQVLKRSKFQEELVYDRCGTVPINLAISKKHHLPSIHEFESWIKKEGKGQDRNSGSRTVISIPVVVHVIHDFATPIGTLPNISDAQIQSQIDALNSDFRRLNSDAANTPTEFASIASDVEIEFCLATVDPDGNTTSGITRFGFSSVLFSVEDIEYVVKPLTIWHPEYYFNIWTIPLQGDLLGYAQFPISSTISGLPINDQLAKTDGVVVNPSVFGVGGTAVAPYDLGRVLTHETGHFFGLRHIGGDGDCTVDDFCADTPLQDGQNQPDPTCPYDPLATGAPLNDCDEGPNDLPDQSMNYMDYSTDACMNLFTMDQKSRIDVILANSPRRASLTTSSVCSGIPPSTTFDPYPYAPANDLCASAIDIACDELKVGNTQYASPIDIPVPCGTSPGYFGVWYRFTGDGSYVSLDLCESDYDTKINVYSGDCSSLTCVAGNDEGCDNKSYVNFHTEQGLDYFIYVSGFNAASGAYRLLRSCKIGLGSSSNIYSSYLANKTQVYANDSLNIVAFIHRQNTSIFGGNTGQIRYDISTDGGHTFANDIGPLNPIGDPPARYPQLTGLNSTNSNDPLQHKLVWTAPTTAADNWQGIVGGVSNIVENGTVTSSETYSLENDSILLGGGLCQGLPGEFWSFDSSLKAYPEGNILGDSLYIQKGIYNPESQDVDWSIYKWIDLDCYLEVDGLPKVLGGDISFSIDGTTGWGVTLGDLVGGQDSVFNPIFVKTTDAGTTWSDPVEVDISSIEIFDNSPSGSSTLLEALQAEFPGVVVNPTCGFEFDITVDSNGHPHMFLLIGTNQLDADIAPPYTVYYGQKKLACDIFSEDGGLTWKGYVVTPITEYSYTFGDIVINNYLQISRSPSGGELFYSWMDRYTTSDQVPNLIIAGHRLSDHYITCPKLITNSKDFHSAAFFPTIAPEGLINEEGNGYKLPIVMTQVHPTANTLAPVQFQYMGNEAIIYDSDFIHTFSTIDYNACKPKKDYFGYTAEGCNNNGSFDWIDVPSKPSAIKIDGLADDNSVGPIPIGFDFKYYWADQSDFRVGSNGWVGFGEESTMQTCFDSIPFVGGKSDNYIAALLSDLTFEGSGNPAELWYWSNQVDSLVISYINVPYYSSNAPGYTGSNTFQIILTGHDYGIALQYLETTGFVDDASCATELQIGIENKNGSDGLLISKESLPSDQCKIKIIYPESGFPYYDAGIVYNQNIGNKVEIVDVRSSIDLKSQITNYGNLGLSDITLTAELINHSSPALVADAEASISSLALDETVLKTLGSNLPLGEPGNHTLSVDLINNQDLDQTNNKNETEILVIDCLAGVTKLDYNTSDTRNSAQSYQNANADLYGFATYFEPPGDGFILDSIELIPYKIAPIETDSTIIRVIANDGALGEGTVLFEKKIAHGEFTSDVPYTLPVGGLETDENGFFVYFGNGLNNYITLSYQGPFSRSNYQIFEGNWSEFSLNNSADLHIRAYVSASDNPLTAVCSNMDIELQNGIATIVSADVDGGSSAYCGIHDMTINGQESLTFDESNLGYNMVTLTVFDLFGNQQSCEAVVNVVPDLCPGADDGIDSDNAGLPDACDCYPDDPFNDNIILGNDKNPGLDFDGINDYLTILNDASLVPTNTNSLTFEAWIKPDQVATYQSIASSANSLSTYNYAIYLLTDKLRVTATGGQLLLSNATIPANEWTHIAVVFDASNSDPALSKIEMYINGQLDNSLTGSFESSNLGSPVFLGNINGANWIYDGTMEEVRFWSDVRTSDEITFYKDRELYGNEPDLLTYYNFNEGVPYGDNSSISTVTDNTSNAFNASLLGFAKNGSESNWINAIAGLQLDVIYQDTLSPCIDCPESPVVSLHFDGNDEYVTIENQDNLIPYSNNTMTFEAWIRPETITGFQAIASSASSLTSYNFAIYLNNDKVTVTARNSIVFNSIASISMNTWTHLAVVFNADIASPALSTIDLYIDGVLDNTLTNSFETNNLGNPILLGSIAGANWPYKGQIDDVRFWNDVRTSEEISAYRFDELYGGEDHLSAYYNFNSGTPAGVNTDLDIVPDMSVNDYEGSLSGFSRMGSKSNWVKGSLMLEAPVNAALAFDGMDDHLYILHAPAIAPTATNAVTIEAWVYPEKISGINMVYSAGVFPNIDNQIFIDNNQLIVTSNGLQGLIGTANIPTSSWTHIAVVFDMTETRLFINGKLDKTRVGNLSTPAMPFDLAIGSQSNGLPANWNFQGKMDDIRIWDYARNAAEIQSHIKSELLGNETGLAAYYNMNSGTPEADNTNISLMEDNSGNQHTAAINGFAKTGAVSNWINSPFRFGDFDDDGLQDYCDNCIAFKNLLLENQQVEGTYRASETITIGTNLTYPADVNLILRAPKVIVPTAAQFPYDAMIRIKPGCLD